MNLILIEPSEVGPGGVVQLADSRARHVRSVLNAEAGRHIRVGLLDGPLGEAVVQRVNDDAVTLCCSFEPTPPGRPRVDLLLALPRPKVMRRLWAQLAALGVGQVMLTNAERVERNYFDTHVLAAEVYRPLLIEGLQQARDTRVPSVSIHRQFKVFVEDELDRLCPEGHRLIADPHAARSMADGLRDVKNERVLVAIGPEGGWNAFERQLLEARGFVAVSLGERTLRSDTACVAILAIVSHASQSSSS